MQWLLIITLLVISIKYLVNLVGKDVISSKVYQTYLRVSGNKAFANLHTKKTELRDINKQRLAISAQDQYAKWTKLNRRWDKLKKEVDELEKTLLVTQAAAINAIKTGLTVVTTGPIWYYRVMHRKSVLVHLPAGLFPSVVEFYLSFPTVARGTIGLGGWMFIVNTMIDSMELIIKNLVFAEKVEKPKETSTSNEEEKKPQPASIEPKIQEIN
ncbi:GET complex subunit [Saccharomycopsis crataegensis]|uniref:Golgi to ER traffic protein 1 n=1 Tax=Saccharomycopsis crataegensis TaxID=43959 RepID=A0AAV5QRK8_9ASCO|nr:GET complex subunit [Saccharomycopsis crataegensis]